VAVVGDRELVAPSGRTDKKVKAGLCTLSDRRREDTIHTFGVEQPFFFFVSLARHFYQWCFEWNLQFLKQLCDVVVGRE